MNILFVTQVLPDENGGGTPRRAASHLRALARIGRVTAVLPNSGLEFPEKLSSIRALGASNLVIREEPSMTQAIEYRAHATRHRPWRMLHQFRRLPYQNGRARPQDRAKYRAVVSGRFDFAFAFRIQSAVWLESLFSAKSALPNVKVVDLDDIESISFRSTALKTPSRSIFWRWKLEHNLRWIERTERRLARDWSAIGLCSKLDAERFAALTGAKAWIVPNSTKFPPPAPQPAGPIVRLLFVGTFGYWPNREGALWFIEKVWPAVRAELGETVALDLAGFEPPADIEALGEHPQVTVHASPEDLAPLYDRAHIVIAPIFSGSGTRVKIIEAAAHNRPVVTTAMGCEGLDLVNGIHAEIADDPAGFAQIIIRLARDPARRDRLAAAAYAHTEDRFSAPKVQEALIAKIENLCRTDGNCK